MNPLNLIRPVGGCVRRGARCVVVLLVAIVSGTVGAQIWDGSSSGYWNVPQNWFGNTPPNPGANAIFPSGAARLVMTNTFAPGYSLDLLWFTGPGYSAYGNPLVLTEGVTASHAAGSTVIALDITNGANLIMAATNNVTLNFTGALDPKGFFVTFTGPGTNQVSGGFRRTGFGGTAVIKEGTGTLLLVASNHLFGGNIIVREGTLIASHSAALGETASAGVTVSNNAVLALQNSIAVSQGLLLHGTLSNSFGNNSISGTVTLAGTSAEVTGPSGTSSLLGPVVGTSGFTKRGNCYLVLEGTNTYSGATELEDGYLIVNGLQSSSPILLNGGVLRGDGRTGPITSVGGGTIEPGASSYRLSCGSLVLNPATTLVTSLYGSPPTNGHLNVSGTVDLGGCVLNIGFVQTGVVPGDTRVLVINDSTDPVTRQFNGLPEGAIFTNTSTRLQITYAGGDGNDVVVTALPFPRVWDGGGANTNWGTTANWNPNESPEQGDDLVFPAGAAQRNNFNNLGQGTLFHSIAFTGDGYVLTGSRLALSNGITATQSASTNTVALRVDLGASQTFAASNGAALVLAEVRPNGHELTLAGEGEIRLAGPILLGGSLVKTGSGLALLSGTNSYTGLTTVLEGTLRLLSNQALGINTDGTVVATGATLAVNPGLIIAEPLTLSGTLQPAAAGASMWNGPITLQGAALLTDVSNSQLTVSGVISGTGSFTKQGAGTLTLTASNTYSGATVLDDGTLLVNGTQPSSIVQLNSGTLGGTGLVGQVFASGVAVKTINPGASIGRLTTSSVLFNSFTRLEMDLNGSTPGVSHDQLSVQGTVNLGNCQFVPVVGGGIAIGQVLRVIDNDGADAVVGTFSGLPEGEKATASNGLHLHVTYHGGDGNDVEFTVMNPPSTVTAVNHLPSGFIQLLGLGLPNVLYTLQATTNLTLGNWSAVTVDLSDGAGLYEFIDVDAAMFERRFYRVLSP